MRLQIYMKILVVSTLILLVFSCNKNELRIEPTPDNLKYKEYVESLEVFANPERGFMNSFMTFSEANPLNQSTLNTQRASGLSVIFRMYYLEKFKNASISETQLQMMESDFTKIRNAGLKCILRFAYTDGSDDGKDANIDTVLLHLDQMKPIFQDNADVIAFVQAGFIGWWGEWHSSTNNLTSIENEKKIVNKLLTVFPPEIKIQLRTPKQKRDVFEYHDAISDDVGYTTENIARVGHHNDCFMASSNDYGTYVNPEEDKEYISKEANYVPTGGETCPPSGIPAATCEIAKNTMQHLKWTYLHLNWYVPVLDGWREDGCFENFERDMGYRLVLKTVETPEVLPVSNLFTFKMVLKNTGWAPLYNYKNTSLKFVSVSNSKIYSMPLETDLRRAKPGESFTVEELLDLSSLPADDYSIHLKIADQFETLATRPQYCVRLANEDIWDDESGLNSLDIILTIKR